MADELHIHSIESFGTHDGPGIRMVLFLQGCKFKCLYCHNPDTIPMEGGFRVPISDLIKRAVNMKGYFGDVGGITVSGGEPLLQSKQLIPFFKLLKKSGINTVVDTNGRVLNVHTKTLLKDYTDLVMLDIKHIDAEWHLRLTGQKNTSPLNFAAHCEDIGKRMWLRYVLVPGWTDQEKHLRQLGEHFKSYKTIEKLQLLPYHKLGEHKWQEMGWKYELTDTPENTPEQVEVARDILVDYFKEVEIR